MRFLQAAVLILASLAPRAEAAEVRLAPVDRPLTVGTTFAMPISVEGSTRPFGGYLFDLVFDHALLTLESLAPEGDHPFSDEFFKNSGIGMGGGQMAGLNSRSLSGPVGSANLTVARFRVMSSTTIFASSQFRNSTVAVSVREAVDMVDTRASTIAVTGATLAFEVVGDTLAPVTLIHFAPPSALSDLEGRPIISTSALVGFSAQDIGAYISGVAQTGYLVDQDSMTVALVTSTAPFTLAAGTHTVIWSSRDVAGNVEVVKSTQVLVKAEDVTPPSLTLTPVSGSTVTSATPEVAAAYFDLESGISTATVRLFLDETEVTGQAAVTASSASFIPAAALAQGTHTASVQVQDRAGNSASASVAFFIDSIPPSTQLLVNGLPTGATELVLISTDSLGFSAFDAGTGAAQTLYALDGSTTPAVFVSTFSLAIGTHTLAFHSVDHVGNAETPQEVALTVRAEDQTAPILSLAPPDASTVTMTRPSIVASYADGESGVDLATVRLTFDGVDVTTQAAVTASSAAFVPATDLSQGMHTATAQVADLVGNLSTATATFLVDSIAPVTTLLVNGLPAGTTSLVIITTDTVGFAAVDTGTGVHETLYALDGTTVPVVFISTFSLTGGAHTLSFHSLDRAGNAEAPVTVSISVFGPDVTPPSLALTPADGSTTTATAPLIVAAYTDAERGVDVATVRLSLDGVDITTQAAVTASSTTFVPAAALAEGTHTIAAQAADLAGNHASSTSTFLVDSIAPGTTLLVNGLPAGSTSLVLISTDTLGFAATDGGSGVLETRYALDGSTTSLVFNSTFSLAGGTYTLTFFSQDRAGNLETLQVTALSVLGEDLTPPSLSLTPPHGSTVTTAAPQLVAAYADLGRGVDSSSVRLSLDGVDITTLAFVTASSAAFVPSSALAQGTHTVASQVADFAGNGASAASTFIVDSIAPVTSLLKNGLATSVTSLVLLSTDTLGFAATDAGTGVLETLYSVDGATATVFVSTFTLSPGGHTLAFHSRDHAGNLEAAQTVSITVTSPSSDTTPPLVRLDFPGASALGVEQAIGGVVNVRGAASDASAFTWTLEAAPGVSATSGFTAIASGAGNLSGLIAAWNTTALTGYQTLRLRAVDAFGNEASAIAGVFVGNPVFNFAIGNKDSNVIVNKIKNPTGIAIRSDGLIWVASTDKDELVLLTSSGGVVAVIEEGIRDFKNPQGLAVDAADRLYVADKSNHRVLKLSPDGSQVLLQIAKLDNHGKPKAGSGTGEFRNPWDVAVDQNGDIFVADSGNSRIQVFNSSGTFLRQFGQGVLLSTSEVRGVTLTAEGLWVSDKEQERVFLFSRAGVLIKSIGDADSVVGEISRMRGLASDRLGALYVVEPNRDRAQKFDPQGKGLLAFGSKAGLSHADKHAKRYLTQPIDAAVAPDGSIWFTDTGRDRIVRYALPASGGYGVAAYSAGGGASSSGSVEPAKRLVDARDGANVERDDGAGVRVPEGALAADLEITVDKGDENQDKEQKTAKRLELKITAVSEEVQYGPEGTTFSAPVTLTLPYDPNLLASMGINEDNLKVYYWNATLQDWQAMPSVVDKVNKTVNAQTTHFSNYQVGGLGGIGVAAIDDFSFRDGYAFPNPSRGGSAVTFRMQPGSADSIEVRVYDVSGRRVHSSSDFRFRGAFDDGNGKGAQNTYDHVWDVSGVGSGVYSFVMTAKKASEKDIRKTGKIGVIK